MLEEKGFKLKRVIDFVIRIINLIKLNKKNQTKKINEIKARIDLLEAKINALTEIR